MFTFVGDTILDPFLGSGTTSLAAVELNRNSVGYEINKDFIPIIKNKVGTGERRLFNQPVYISITQELPNIDYYVCKVCGNTVDNVAPERCSICGASQAQFIRVH